MSNIKLFLFSSAVISLCACAPNSFNADQHAAVTKLAPRTGGDSPAEGSVTGTGTDSADGEVEGTPGAVHGPAGTSTSGPVSGPTSTPAPNSPVLQQCLTQGNFSSQTNSSGRIIIYQSDATNVASVVQVGSNNFAQVTQVGSNNFACVVQIGDGQNSAVVNQSNSGGGGSTNSSVVHQGSFSGNSPAPTAASDSNGQNCLCQLLSYCQSHPSDAFCASLK